MDWQGWIDRWDRQQEAYMANRELRFGVIADVVAWAAGGAAPRVLDLGCGPGSLSARIADRFPGAQVVAVDNDPVTELLGQRAYADRTASAGGGAGITWIDADLADPSWVEKVAGLGPFDAAVSTTALHWLAADALVRVYEQVAQLVRPGGVFADGDHLKEPAGTRLAELQTALRQLPVDERELWEPWWEALEAEAAGEPLLAEAFAERARRLALHPVGRAYPGLELHAAALRSAGFAEVGTVWQHGDDRVLVGLR